VEADHHVFLNLQTKRFYCLPDDYEVLDSSLNDIKVADALTALTLFLLIIAL